MGMMQLTCIPARGNKDACPAPEAAATPLVVVEKQHTALEVGAEEAAMLLIGDG
jgi:hypothetical protein